MTHLAKNGYVALISTIIIGALVLVLALAIAFIAISWQQMMIGQNQALKSYYLANACAHYAVIKLQDNATYNGNEIVSIDNYNCQVEQISGSGNTSRTILASSNVASHITRIRVVISQIKPQTIINSWQEIYN